MSSSSIIPPEITGLSTAEAFEFYRDELKWHVLPVYPPDAECNEPGKQPAIKQWWNKDPLNIDIDRRFRSKHPCNIGVAPKGGLIFIDLDSKPDQGATVQQFLKEHSELATVPQHLSRRGVHLVMLCLDLPQWKSPRNGKPFYGKLIGKINENVTAELFHCDHQNLVLPPSIHPSGHRYAWQVFGEVPKWVWKKICELFCFEEPEASKPCPHKTRRGKSPPWHRRFHGDLASLDLVGLLNALACEVVLFDGSSAKYQLKCPWSAEHSEPPNNGTSTVVWQPGNAKWPWFKCSHSHCVNRHLREVLEWAEEKSPGIVDRFCSHSRIWDEGAQWHKNIAGKPQVLHAVGRLESEVYTKVGEILAPHHSWFVRGSTVNTIECIPSGFIYTGDPDTRYTIAAYIVGFREMTAIQAKGSLEKFMEPGVTESDGDGNPVFKPKSFSTDFCAGLVQSDQLKDKLPRIARILTVPLPFRIENKLVYPKKGYDPRFATYLMPDAPEVYSMPLEEAHQRIETILAGFCFTNQQSKTHAIARMLTPFARAILGWTTRVPLWFFFANRPRAGKDYLNGVTLIVYEGRAFEDLPIGKEQEETGKRIMAAARNGRRFMHFSNCQIYLQDQYLIQAITNPIINGRRLGSNDPTSDLSIPNEMEFSVSANVGLGFREDLEPRMRKIELAFSEEDPNSRTFPDKFLHRTIQNDRAGALSAIAAFFNYWAQTGFLKGATPFTTYPEWAETIGGIMQANGFDNPCLPFVGKYDEIGGDDKTAAITALFQVCYVEFKEAPVKNKQIIDCVKRHQNVSDDTVASEGDEPKDGATDNQVEALRWFGSLEGTEEARKNQSSLMRIVRAFKDRILGGIKLVVDESSAHRGRHTYRFLRMSTPSTGHQAPPSGSSGEPSDGSSSYSRGNQVIKSASACLRNSDVQGGEIAPKPAENAPQGVAMSPYGALSGAYARKGCTYLFTLNLESSSRCNTLVKGVGKEAAHGYMATPPSSFESLALDLETYASDKRIKRGALCPWKGDIRLVTLADDGGNGVQIDLHTGPLPGEIRNALLRLPLVVHHAAFDLLFLAVKLDLVPEQQTFCTLTAARLLSNGTRESNDLGVVLKRYLDVDLPKDQGASDWGAMLLTQEQIEYARDDVRYLLSLKMALTEGLQRAGLERVFTLESELIPVVVQMEATGIAVDSANLHALHEQSVKCVEEFGARLQAGFGVPELNVNSPDQILAAFAKVGVVLSDTAETTLAQINHPLARLILKYRAEAKLGSTTLGLLEAITSDGRIHARFNPLGATSGRFSSSGPNLQNIPRGELRSCFVASSPEHRLVIADYSQMELRAAAVIAKDAAMIKAFRVGCDLHAETAAAVLGKELAAVTKADRQLAKAVNFGFLYGQEAPGFCRYAKTEYDINLSLQEAAAIRERFFVRYTGLAAWHRAAYHQSDTRTEGRTLIGRRILPHQNEKEGQKRWNRFQMGVNYVIQGSCADVLKLAMVRLMPVLPSSAHLLLTVHDELVLECMEGDAKIVAAQTEQVMKEAFRDIFGDTLAADVETKICQNWGEKY